MASYQVKGIDVSYAQGKINWDKVKESGIQFAILRCGYGSDIKSQDDSQFARNMSECERVGMPFGIYLFSYANSVAKAKSEAEHVLRLIKGHKIQYPIYYDLEDARTTGNCSKALILEMAQTFVETLEKAGYWAGIYANLSWNRNYLTDKWYDTKARWVAQYYDRCTYDRDYGMWQYTSSGKVPGISGNVDMNYCYVDYPALIKEAGLNGYTKSTTKTESTTTKKPTTTTTTATTKPKKKSMTTLVNEILDGKWGNGAVRKAKLIKAGYDYDKVQEAVTAEQAKRNAKAKAKYSKGAKVVLKKTKAFANSVIKSSYGTVSGTYYLYDGKSFSGRYRVTNSKANCGKTPASKYVSFYINKSDIK